MKIQRSTKKSKFPENLPKYVYINFQIWFQKYKFKDSKYIKNVDVHSLRTPGIGCVSEEYPSRDLNRLKWALFAYTPCRRKDFFINGIESERVI